jgi:hypothetical protein
VQDHRHLAVRAVLALVRTVAIAACVGVGTLAWAPLAAAAPPPAPAASGCDAIHGLTILDRTRRGQLHQACTGGPAASADLYTALFRLVSSPGWHAGVMGSILRRHDRASLTAWADGGSHDPPPSLVAQATIEAQLRGFEAGTVCPEIRRSKELDAFLAAMTADEVPEPLPFTSRFATCLGVPASTMEGIRLLTIRADGLHDVTVVLGTPTFVHAHRFTRDQALHLGSHRFFVVAVPEASPVLVIGTHENQALPVVWRGMVARNELVWGTPPRRSCLDLSVKMNAGTHLYVDGVRLDGGPEGDVCEPAPGSDGSNENGDDDTRGVDQTLAITLDLHGSGLPDHEVVALTCEGEGEGRRPVVRHASSLPATAPADRLRPVNVCEPLRLDLSTPATQRVAVLGVTKLPGCETTPLWASDVQERVRHVLSRDVAHRNERSYANFSAYAEASEALSTLESRLGRRAQPSQGSAQGADADTLIGSAAQEAWRQGIDTLLSLAVQCTPRGHTKSGEALWSYSMRATAIDVGELFARGYHERDGLDLEGFIDVDSVAFDAPEQQDASIGTLLDRVFEVELPRFAQPAVQAHYRTPQTLRISRFHGGLVEGAAAGPAQAPQSVVVRYKAFAATGSKPFRIPKQGVVERDRPPECEGLVHRGARPPDALRAVYPDLPGKEREVVIERNHDEVDASSGGAMVYEGEVLPPRPGWYLVSIDGDDDGVFEIDDAICIHSTAPATELWLDMVISGGPLAYAKNGSRSQVYLRPRVGWTRYFHGRWLGAGVSLGYGFTNYAGQRGDWTDLGVAAEERLRWQRHALLLMPYLEARTRSTALPVEFRARLGPIVDSALVDIERVSDELVDFRAGHDEDAVLDVDLDLGLDLAVGAPIGPMSLQVLVMLAYAAVDDPFARSATTVTQDANLYMGFGFAIGGGRR